MSLALPDHHCNTITSMIMLGRHSKSYILINFMDVPIDGSTSKMSGNRASPAQF